jgi:hypothetical protein
MDGLTFERDPENPGALRVSVDGRDLKWRWRLSRNPVSVDWLFQQLRTSAGVRLRGEVRSPDFLQRVHAIVTGRVRDHWVPGDPGYEPPQRYEESKDDQKWAEEEKRKPGTIAQMLAGLRWQHERELRLLRHENEMLRGELGKEKRATAGTKE